MRRPWTTYWSQVPLLQDVEQQARLGDRKVSVTAKTTGDGQPLEARTVREIVREQRQLTGLYGLKGWFTEEVADDLEARLDVGEKEYGNKLRVGWAAARNELYQEILDALLYAISCQDYACVEKLLPVLRWLHAQRTSTGGA